MSGSVTAKRIRPTGELTIQTAAERHAAFSEAIQEAEELTIDLSRVTEFDTAGLQVLLAARAEARSRGRQVLVVSPAAVVREVLTLCRLGEDLERVATATEGRAA